MNARQFFDLVSQMRDAQKEYFRTKKQSTLKKSIELEKQVDDEILRVKIILAKTKK